MHRLVSSFVLTALFCGAAALAATQPADLALTNAEGTLRFSLHVRDGAAAYTVDRLAGATAAPVLELSPLGLTRTDADFATGLTFVAAGEVRAVEDEYTLVAGKQRHIRSRGVERTFTLRNAAGMTLTIAARAYRDGVAFRYGLPGAGAQLLRISGEATGFNLPDGARVWAQPYSKVAVWAPGYEADYANGVPAGTAAPAEQGWALPLLFHSGATWALITESALEPTYFASHLQQQAPGGLYRVRLPEADETYGVAPQEAAFTLPWVSPWRMVVVGSTPGAISDSTLITDLARPSELAETAWIKPGVASWSWWSDMSSPGDYAKLVPFVDAAARFRWPYSLIDLGWHEMRGGDIKRLADYAARKNVGLLVWYNSAGKHNQVPEAGPRDVLNDPLRRDAEFARIAALGIKGIKVDFMQSDKQFVVALYHDILRDAARHHLVVNFHGATIPRGWNRTYPHLLTMEAVRGGEQYWDRTFAEQAHTLHTIYAFTRNAVGPMDYTPTVLTDPGASNPQLQPHLTTNAHELALLVVFQSGLQHVIDPAASLVSQPAFVQDYLTDLPAAWDESRCLAGAPGELAVFARRSGSTWYVAGINGLKTPQTIEVPLAFLGAGQFELSLIADGAKPSEFAHAARTANAGETLELTLAGRGGFAAKLVPAAQ
ncbi:MAG: glycoside hydrolase family 97 catalytic domain-containing protein [Opitutaceae bacterium]